MKFLDFLKSHLSLLWALGGALFAIINLIHPFIFSEFIELGIFAFMFIFRVYEIEIKTLAKPATSSASLPPTA